MPFVLKLVLLLGLTGHCMAAQAQDVPNPAPKGRWWMPHHAALQYAGNIGLFAVGPGYRYAQHKMQTDILYGFTPRYQSETGIHSLTLKTAFHPYKIRVKQSGWVEPLRLGLGFNYAFGDQFHTRWPDRYPSGYYWWSSSLRLTPFIGTMIGKEVGNRHTLVKQVKFYAELGSHDLALISFLNNKKLPVFRVLNLAVGTNVVF